MKSRLFIYLLTLAMATSCGHRGGSKQQNPIEVSTGVRDKDRLTCIVKGNDSIIYYHGVSSQMQEIKRGLLNDTAFTETLFRTVRVHGYLLTFKPGDGGDVLPNFREMVNLANDHGVSARSVLAIDANENKAFGVATPVEFENAISGKDEPPLKLNLPRDESGKADSEINAIPKGSRLIVLVAGDSGLYVYWGDNIQQGKKYSYQGLTDMLKTKAKDKKVFVVLRPSALCSYKNTVDALDMMKTAGIERYGLFDINLEEEDWLRQTYQ
jgi:biopolymer transport protein ExbD